MNRRSGEPLAAVGAGVEVATGLVLIIRPALFGELLFDRWGRCSGRRLPSTLLWRSYSSGAGSAYDETIARELLME